MSNTGGESDLEYQWKHSEARRKWLQDRMSLLAFCDEEVQIELQQMAPDQFQSALAFFWKCFSTRMIDLSMGRVSDEGVDAEEFNQVKLSEFSKLLAAVFPPDDYTEQAPALFQYVTTWGKVIKSQGHRVVEADPQPHLPAIDVSQNPKHRDTDPLHFPIPRRPLWPGGPRQDIDIAMLKLFRWHTGLSVTGTISSLTNKKGCLQVRSCCLKTAFSPDGICVVFDFFNNELLRDGDTITINDPYFTVLYNGHRAIRVVDARDVTIPHHPFKPHSFPTAKDLWEQEVAAGFTTAAINRIFNVLRSLPELPEVVITANNLSAALLLAKHPKKAAVAAAFSLLLSPNSTKSVAHYVRAVSMVGFTDAATYMGKMLPTPPSATSVSEDSSTLLDFPDFTYTANAAAVTGPLTTEQLRKEGDALFRKKLYAAASEKYIQALQPQTFVPVLLDALIPLLEKLRFWEPLVSVASCRAIFHATQWNLSQFYPNWTRNKSFKFLRGTPSRWCFSPSNNVGQSVSGVLFLNEAIRQFTTEKQFYFALAQLHSVRSINPHQKLIADIRIDVLNKNLQGEEVSGHPRVGPFQSDVVIQRVPGKGRGLICGKDFKKGELIVSQPQLAGLRDTEPVFAVVGDEISHGERHTFASLPNSMRRFVRLLHRACCIPGGTLVVQQMNTLCFSGSKDWIPNMKHVTARADPYLPFLLEQMPYGAEFDPYHVLQAVMQNAWAGAEMHAMVGLVSFVNHDERPACIKEVTKDGWHELFAVRDLKQGEELSICYIPLTKMFTEFQPMYRSWEITLQRNPKVLELQKASQGPFQAMMALAPILPTLHQTEPSAVAVFEANMAMKAPSPAEKQKWRMKALEDARHEADLYHELQALFN